MEIEAKPMREYHKGDLVYTTYELLQDSKDIEFLPDDILHTFIYMDGLYGRVADIRKDADSVYLTVHMFGFNEDIIIPVTPDRDPFIAARARPYTQDEILLGIGCIVIREWVSPGSPAVQKESAVIVSAQARHVQVGGTSVTYEMLVNGYDYPDGAPCGVLEHYEEETDSWAE